MVTSVRPGLSIINIVSPLEGVWVSVLYVYFFHCGACRGFVVLQRRTRTTAVHLLAAQSYLTFGNLPCK